MLRGIGTSKGIGIGKALIIHKCKNAVSRVKIKDTEAEVDKFNEAVEKFIQETNELVDKLSQKLNGDDKNALVLKNQEYLIRDPEFTSGVISAITNDKLNAEAAVEDTCEMLKNIFLGFNNDTMTQRVADIEDMKQRLIAIMQGQKHTDLTKLSDNTVIIADEIHPSMTANMDTEHIAGIISEKGGDTSHASILARALEIPAVLSVKDICSKIAEGEEVIVDGAYGEVFVNPTPITLKIYNKKKKAYDERVKELKKYIDKQTVTRDGRKVMLAANIGNADEAAKAVKAGAEGVGLFRTEFLFMNKQALPTEEEQYNEYKKAAVVLDGRQLTIRTLDIGGDKDIPYMGLTKELNPFLGYRAIRFCLDRVDIFTTQLRAVLRASAYGNIRIMIPMITSVTEVQAVKKIINGICRDLDKKDIKYDKDIKIGVMIETPAAAKFQSEETGCVDYAGTEDEILAQIRELVSMLPLNNEGDVYTEECEDDLNRACASMDVMKGDARYLLSEISDGHAF